MITIGGVEYGLFWSIKAHCDYDEWLMRNRNSSYTKGIVKKAVFANEAYRAANGIKGPELTEAIINKLPNSEYAAIKAAVEAQIIKDSGMEIKTVEPDAKNAEGSAG